MRWLIGILLLFLILLQYRLWVGEGSMAQKVELEKKLSAQQEENEQLKLRNQLIADEVNNLRNGLEGIEEKARNELGMIKEGETFFMVIEKPARSAGEGLE